MKKETQNLFENFQSNLKESKNLKEDNFYGSEANEKVGGNYDDFIYELSNFRASMNIWYDKCSTRLAQQIIEDTIMSFDNIIARYEQQKDIEIQGSMNESAEVINEEEKSIYDYTEEDIESMNLDEMINLYVRICDESDFDNEVTLSNLNKYGCLNTGSFRNMLEETIEYMHYGDNE